MPDQSLRRPWIGGFRFSVRSLMVVVLLFAAVSGWIAHLIRQARIQRSTVDAVARLGGSVLYDWQFENGNLRVKPGTNFVANEVPGWPKWVVDRLGVDAFGSVTDVSISRVTMRRGAARASIGKASPDEIEEALRLIGHLSRLKHLAVFNMPVNDGGLVHLKRLSTLESLVLRGRNEVTDAGVAHLARMISLKGLYLEDSQISDASLAYLGKLTGLETLNLARTHVGDGGLAHLDGLTRLENLGLDGTKITDEGLVRFLGRRATFKALHMNDSQIGDAGLAPLAHITGLGSLLLRSTRVSNAGLVHVSRLTTLQSLDLYHTRVSDAGLAYLKELTSLQYLTLDGTEITDAGLRHLEGLTSLKELRLLDTRVTRSGVEQLRRALPKAAIHYSSRPVLKQRS